MTLLSESPLLNLDTTSVHLIDTQNTQKLHDFWSVFSQLARTDSVQNARRLENLSWRIYSQQALSRSPSLKNKQPTTQSTSNRELSVDSIPGLSTSPGSPTSSDDGMGTPPDSDMTTGMGHVGLLDNSKTISPVKLETIVKSVTENNEIEPLSPLPASIRSTTALQAARTSRAEQKVDTPAPQPENLARAASQAEPLEQQFAPSRNLESSSSTMATQAMDSEIFEHNHHLPTADSTSTEISSTSIVRGFSKDMISSSRRSHAHLNNLPPPILKHSPSPSSRPNPLARPKKQPKFLVGASSEGDESSWESPNQISSLTQGLKSISLEKQPIKFPPVKKMAHFEFDNSESAIEDDDEDDDDEDDDDEDDDWIDDEDQSEEPAELFRRVDSTNNLRSRPSLLTNMLHEKDRAKALQNAASKSTSAIRRSRTSSHNGPLGPDQPSYASGSIAEASSSNAIPVSLSPRSTRRFMLQSELTGSIRKHLVWERQSKNPAARALKNRQFRSEIGLPGLAQQAQQPQFADSTVQPRDLNDKLPGSTSGSYTRPPVAKDNNDYYAKGLHEYFEKGW